MKHYPWPKIGQFKDVIRGVEHKVRFKGVDENGNAIYSDEAAPKLYLTGTIKVHGTNAGIVMLKDGTIYAQSRERVITPTDDNFGFAQWVKANEEAIREQLFGSFKNFPNENLHAVVIFGEWAGPKVQDGVAVSGLPEKSFFVFPHMHVVKTDGTVQEHLNHGKAWKESDLPIYRLSWNKIYELMCDFNDPQSIQNKLVELTLAVEENCPVGASLGLTGIGEGIVWTFYLGEEVFRFKTKGKEHTASKVKTLVPIDEEHYTNVKAFVAATVTENRVNQAIERLFGDSTFTRADVVKVMDWVKRDIVEEEFKALTESKLEFAAVAPEIMKQAKAIFFKKFN